MAEKSFGVAAPSLSLPKGGGAIKGIGEKFAANPVTGTGAMTIPISISPGRSGFGPQLALSYDSGTGNGAFGRGWNLSLPAITRKTDKGLPQYRDAEESDVFILSGAEDLVPLLVKDGSNWVREQLPACNVNRASFRIDRYRPRIEGPFARIERWSNVANPADIRWRSISKDNLTTWYGSDAGSRIADPSDPSHIFSWLICQTHDDKGNVMVYEYAGEDSQGIDLAQPQERNRTDAARGTHRYLRRIRYGNRTPYFPDYDPAKTSTPLPSDEDWMFSVVFDYDEGRYQPDSVAGADPQLVHATFDPITPQSGWPVRQDPFSSYRSGFEVRTYRLCRRVLMFHHFAAELNTPACLVRSTEFNYQEEPVGSFITSVIQSGYLRLADGDPLQTGDIYRKRSLPPVEFEYSKAEISSEIRDVDPSSLENLPVGLDGSAYQWVDLDGEGLTGILAEQGGAWYYKRNLSALPQPTATGSLETRACFAPVECVARLPASATAAGRRHQFLDLAGDGSIDVVEFGGPTPGFYERTREGSWGPFTPFRSLPNLAWDDPNQRFIDLTGDGHADILITEDNVFTFHASLAEEGFDQAEKVYQSFDDEIGPRLLVADTTVSISVADMSGDGLADLVRIRNGEVCYWPNLGYGRFGAKVTLDNSPWFDPPDQFDPKRLRLADIDGSGTTDLIYLGRNRIAIYRNLAGNRFTDAEPLDHFPPVDNQTTVQACDLLGNGTTCLVWSSPWSSDRHRPMRYIDLMGGQKPHLLVKTRNNLGAETTVQYAPSTKFYLADKLAGRPWITKLPFPVHCVEKTTVTDKWRRTKFSTTYSYHHGYFDGVEREFRGFGRVEQIDVEDYGTSAEGNIDSPYITQDQTLYQPPVKTVTWFHTGAAIDRERILTQFQSEYFPNSLASLPATGGVDQVFREKPLPEPDLEALNLTADEWREALRACKGMTLRQEVYELDVDALQPGGEKLPKQIPVRLFLAATHNCGIRCLQPKGDNPHAAFLVTESEALSYHYELDLRTTPPLKPDPRVAHTLNLSFDEYGNIRQSVAVGYPRWRQFDDPALATQADLIRKVQRELYIAYSETRYTKDVVLPEPIAGQSEPIKHHRLRLPCEVLTYELKGIEKTDAVYYALANFHKLDLSDKYGHEDPATVPPPVPVARKEYHEHADGSVPQKRILEHARTLYFDDESDTLPPTVARPFGHHGPRGLKYEDYKLALTGALLDAVFTQVDAAGNIDEKLNWQLKPAAGPTPKVTARDKLDEPVEPSSPYLKSGYILGTGIDASLTSQYWMRSGTAGFAPDAAQHFYLPENYTDAFNNITTLQYDPLDLFVQSSRDALSNTASVEQFDYRVLTPFEMKDPNDNYSAVAFDIFGLPVASAVMGKNLSTDPTKKVWEGDDLTGFDLAMCNPAPGAVQTFSSAGAFDVNRANQARSWLGRATTRFVYHFGEERDAAGTVTSWAKRMAGACAIMREIHATQLGGVATTLPIQVALECSDGTGNVMMKKAQAEPDPDVPGAEIRWIINGLTVLNNKGKPVKQYEPAFSPDFGCELPQANGVTPLMYYDAAGRLLRTELPDGTLSRVEFSPWHVKTFDQNDSVKEARWYRERLTAVERGELLFQPGASAQEQAEAYASEALAAAADAQEKHAAQAAANHANTPALTILDSLGREVISIAHNRIADAAGVVRDERYLTYTKLDAEGKPLWIRDALGNLVMQYITPPKLTRWADESNEEAPANSVPCYDIAGNLLFQHSMDAGDRWMLTDAAGKPMLAWDSNKWRDKNGVDQEVENRLYFTEYDELHRPTRQWLIINNQPRMLIDFTEYGETLADAKQRNLRGQARLHYDTGGLGQVEQLDFKGKPLEVKRTLTNQYQVPILDWDVADRSTLLEAATETFSQRTEYDALGRMTRLYNWHRGVASRVAVYVPTFNKRGLLLSETLDVGAAKTPSGHTPSGKPLTNAIVEIRYNVKGQKECLKLGNGTVTRYTYDPENFRLRRLYTRRGAGFTDDCGGEPPPPRMAAPDTASPPGSCGVQNLAYTYDPVGNINHIQDDAQPVIYFQNARIDPSSDYVYDALYRLIKASGREDGASAGAPVDLEELPGRTIPDSDPKALRRYSQRYVYDAVGNIEKMRHIAGSNGSWTRHYRYATDSNRLTRTWLGNNTAVATQYRFDLHGNMLNLANVAEAQYMRWDYRDMIRTRNFIGGGNAYYNYDAGKQRTRKRLEQSGSTVEDRIYLGGLEVYRKIVNGTLVEEIESLHVIEGEQRVLLVDDVITASASSPGARALYRYQYSNHLGSAGLELDDQAAIISFEEYHPYGTNAYRAKNGGIEVPPKRYRYTGMERDEESGLNYHGARYLSCALARWIIPDPAGISDGINVFRYAKNNPVSNIDTGGLQTVGVMKGLADLARRDLEQNSQLLADMAHHPEQYPSVTKDTKAALRAEISALTKTAVTWEATAETTTDFHKNVGLPFVVNAGSMVVTAPVGAALAGTKAGAALAYYGLASGTFGLGETVAGKTVSLSPLRPSEFGKVSDLKGWDRVAHGLQSGSGVLLSGVGIAQSRGNALGGKQTSDPVSPQARAGNQRNMSRAAAGEAPSPAEFDAAGGQRVFYVSPSPSGTPPPSGRVVPASVAVRTNGNNINFDTRTNARFVELALEQAGRSDPGGHIHVGSGTHGNTKGAWAATDLKQIEPKFYQQDVVTTAPGRLPDVGPRSVINVGAAGGELSFEQLEQAAANAAPGTLKSMAAWCFSTLKKW